MKPKISLHVRYLIFQTGMKNLFILLVLIFSLSSFSEKIIIIDNDSVNHFSISKYVYILEDSSNNLEISQVILAESNKYFKLNNSSVLNLGFTKSAYWVKFSVINTSAKTKNLIFSIDYPLLRSIKFYAIKGAKLEKSIITGEKEKFNSRDIQHRSFLFDLELEPNLEYTYYARVYSEGGTLRLPMEISSYKSFVTKDKFEIAINGVFIGLVILSILFNLFLLYVSREMLNLYYTVFVASLALFLVNISGLSYQYFWPDYPWFEYHSTIFFVLIANIFLLLFTRAYFNFKENYKKTEILFRIILPISIIIAISTFTVEEHFYIINRIANGMSFFTILLLLFVATIGVFRRDKFAIYLLISFSAFIFGVILYVLRNFGLHSNNYLAENGLKFGFIVEIIFLMFAVIDRYTYMEKRDNLRLEKIVKLRTSAIQAQKEEIESQRDKIIKQHEDALAQKEIISSKSEEIKKSFDYARIIQNAVLPPRPDLDRILNNYFILNLPKEILGGDFYWLTQKNDRIYIAAADCTGHGVPGAMMSMLGVSALNDIISRDSNKKPSEILQDLSMHIERSLHQKGEIGETKDGMDISICMIDKITNTIMYAGSNNSIYIVRDTGFIEKENETIRICNYKESSLLEFKSDKISLGFNPKKNAKFTDKKLTLKKNDMVYLFSDGFADQFGGENLKKYKYQNFRKLLAKNSLLYNPSVQYEQLTTELYNWKKSSEQIDDILVIGIRI